MAINSNVCSHLFHFRPDDDWSIQSKRRQVIFRAIVGKITFIDVHVKVLEVTNDQTKMYLQAISSEIGPKLQLCCGEAALYYGFVIKRR